MKHLLIALLTCISLAAMPQRSAASNLRTRISDDNRTLSIQLDGNQGGRKIHLSETFDVTGMNPVQKEFLKYRTFRSVGVFMPIREMPWLIFGPLCLIIFSVSLLVVRYQTKHRGLTRATLM
ncbi:hypothetical protein [Spirosoma radiotolerans]|uniref:hypothetical protein n=1 Tax=Spirosoma radiotolerans TaxID=1379870 RepID=UPI0006978836|nr:hypothetical protein [Spirosoma radiotolerans]